MEMLRFSIKPLRTPHIRNHLWVSNNSRILGVYSNKDCIFSFSVTCKLKTSKGKKFSKKMIVPGKFSLPDYGGAPLVLERKVAEEKRLLASENADGKVVFNKVPKRVLGVFSNLSLAIGEMFAVAGLMALGAIIDQGNVPDYYFHKFHLDHMFSSPIFLGTLALFAASLMACTRTTQVPLEKVARRQSFLNSAEATRKQEHVDQQTLKQEHADTLPRASVKDSDVTSMGAGYEEVLNGRALYAFEGLAGRVARIGVHLALLLVMSGGNHNAAGSFGGDVTVPHGLNFVVGDVLAPSVVQSTPSDTTSGTEAHVDGFNMDYNESGEVSQFQNELSAMKNEEGPHNVAMAPLKLHGDKKLTVTFLPVGDGDSPNLKRISMLARDLQSIIVVDKEGKFACVRRPNSIVPIDIDGTKFIVVDAISSGGLDLKADPGLQIFYAGLGFLMLTTCISYLSQGQDKFPDTVRRLLDQVLELVESSCTEKSDSSNGF